MKKHLLYTSAIIAMAAAFAPAQQAEAAGFYIQEQSASGLGAAFAGQAATARDATTVYSNPAGMTQLDGAQANIGLHLIQPITDIDDRGSNIPAGFNQSLAPSLADDGDNAFNLLTVPNMSVAYPVEGVLDRPLWVGLTVNNPFGLAIDYGEDFIGRFVGTNAELTTINISPNLAYEVTDGLSIGGGLNFEYANARFEFATPNPFAAGDGLFSLRGSDWEIGANFGLLYQPVETTSLALTYRTGISHDADTSVDFEKSAALGGNDALSSARTNVDLPDIAQFAVAHDWDDQWTLLGSVTWFGWSNFEELRIETDDVVSTTNTIIVDEHFKDTFAIALGAEYEWNEDWTFRGGVQFDESPIGTETRSPTIPDADRYWLTAGATYNLNERLSLDAGAAYIFLDDTIINRDTFVPGVGTAETDLDYKSKIIIGSVGLNYKF